MDAKTEYLTAKELAALIGLELSTFRRMVAAGQLPQAVQVMPRLKMWPVEDVKGIAWLLKTRERMRKSTPDEEERDAE